MKTAVSIPDDVYERAERLARKTNRSRSRLFSDALDEYLTRHSSDEITEAMNSVVSAVGQVTDPFSREAARRRLAETEW